MFVSPNVVILTIGQLPSVCRKETMNASDLNKLKKIFSALELPMNPDESLNYDTFGQLIEYELSIGVEGFYCMGSSGEALLLSLEERKQALEKIVQIVSGRVPVIAHMGTIRTQDAVALARHAAAAGVDAISMIPPYYYKFSMEEIIRYYEMVCELVPDIGMIVYNIPQFTGIEFNKENAGRLLSNPQIIGVKHTSNNLYALERMKAAYPDKVFFNGFDEQLVGAFAMGVDATIGTTVNVFAPLFREARRLFCTEETAQAFAIQHELNHYVETMCQVGIFSAVKYILTRHGIPMGTCRCPFHPLSREECAKLDQLVNRYDQFRANHPLQA